MAVPRYSANGQSRSVMIDSTGALITQTLAPNVSNFGWTSNDLTSVKDLVIWVDTAQNAAQSASDNAEYVEQAVTAIQDLNTDINAKLVEANALNTSLHSYVTSTQADINAKITNLGDIETRCLGYANLAKVRGDWILELYNNFVTMYEALRVQFPTLPPSLQAPDAP